MENIENANEGFNWATSSQKWIVSISGNNPNYPSRFNWATSSQKWIDGRFRFAKPMADVSIGPLLRRNG